MAFEYIDDINFQREKHLYVKFAGWVISNNNFTDEYFTEGWATVIDNNYHNIFEVVWDDDPENPFFFELEDWDDEIGAYNITAGVIPAPDIWLGADGFIKLDMFGCSEEGPSEEKENEE